MRLIRAVENFFEEEKGASHLVEIIVVIVIVIAIAGVFKNQLSSAIEAIFSNLNNFINSSNHSGV